MSLVDELRPFKYHLITGAFLLIGGLTYLSAQEKTPLKEPESPLNISTFIPAGYSLVPIEISNYETLDSMMGQYALVDLYIHRNVKYRPGALVAQNLRLLRSPVKANKFAVLVKLPEVSRLLKASSTFFVTLKAKEDPGIELVKSMTKKTSRITVESK